MISFFTEYETSINLLCMFSFIMIGINKEEPGAFKGVIALLSFATMMLNIFINIIEKGL